MAWAQGGTRARCLTWAFLGCLLVLSPGCQHTLTQNITEAMPPEVPAQSSLSLPPDIDQYPFSSFISIGFQVGHPSSALAGRPSRFPTRQKPSGPLSSPSFLPLLSRGVGCSCIARKISVERK